MSALRVVVVDDQAVIRGGLRMIVDNEADLTTVGEAADGLEAVRVVAAAQPDVVLMDVRMPEVDGIEATRRILAGDGAQGEAVGGRSEEHKSELQSLMRIPYAVFCLIKKINSQIYQITSDTTILI